MQYDYVIVGAGLSGATSARLLAESGQKVLVIEKNHHIAGICFDCFNDYGIFVHRYGPHLFHTNKQDVWNFVNLYSQWIPYEHIAKVQLDKKFYDFPVNKNTLSQLNIQDFPEKSIPDYSNAKTYLISTVGPTLTDLIFDGYSKKQWGCSLEELDSSIVERVKFCPDKDSRYFRDKYQAIPEFGYTKFVTDLLRHDNISLVLGMRFFNGLIHPIKKIIYTGPIDQYFDYRFGQLDYISVKFIHKTFQKPIIQKFAQINHPESQFLFTRATEYKHITKQKHEWSSVSYEYPNSNFVSAIPCYPKLNNKSIELFQRYYELAQNESNIIFLGRMAEYKYFNMDAAIENAINKTKLLLQ